MMKSLNEQLESFQSTGAYMGFWFDWTCPEDELWSRSTYLIDRLYDILSSPKLDSDHMYAFFSNGFPGQSRICDELRIANRATGETQYTISISREATNQAEHAEIWNNENDFREPLIAGTWSHVRNYFFPAAREEETNVGQEESGLPTIDRHMMLDFSIAI